MGTSLSSATSPQYTREELLSLLGDRFDDATFEALKSEGGVVTLEQLVAAASAAALVPAQPDAGTDAAAPAVDAASAETLETVLEQDIGVRARMASGEQLHYDVQGLPCGVWIYYVGRHSKYAIVERDGSISLAWNDQYEGTRLRAKGRIVSVVETFSEHWVFWEVTMRGDYKFLWFQEPPGSLPGGFLSRKDDKTGKEVRRGSDREEREIYDVEYCFELRSYRSNPQGCAKEAREEAAAALAGEDAELMASIRAKLEAPDFPFIVEEPMRSYEEEQDDEEEEC